MTDPDTTGADLIIEFGEWLQKQQTEREHDE